MINQEMTLPVPGSQKLSPVDSSICVHCGAPCPDSAPSDEVHRFCCAGCRTVFKLLRENQLCAADNVQTPPAISLKQSRASRFEYLDDESVSGALIQFRDGTLARTTLRLPQIHCTSCVRLLESLFKINPAILRSEINFLKKEIAITFREQEISLREIVELLTRLGYEPEITLNSVAGKSPHEAHAEFNQLYLKIGLAGFAFGNVMLFSFPDYLDGTGALSIQFSTLFAWLSVLLATPVLLYSASDYFVQSWQTIRQRKISLEIPVALGIVAIYFRSLFDIMAGIGTGYLDSFTGLVFFLLIGKFVQKKTFSSLSFDRDYASYFPLSVIRLENSTQRSIPVARLNKEDRIFVRHRELVPADSILQSSEAMIDYSFVTGEAEPVAIRQGEKVFAGGRVAGAGVEFQVEKEVSQSYLTQLWNNAAFRQEKRSSLLDLSDAFGRYFTIIVSSIACGAFLYWLPNWHQALNAFTAVLIIACPCALTLAAPFTLGAAMTILGKAKFYLKNAGVVMDLARVDALVFDKTGTLTQPDKAEVCFHGEPLSESEKQLIASCLRHSTHPLSQQIFNFLNVSSTLPVTDFRETSGLGLEGRVNQHLIAIGSSKWLTPRTSQMPASQPGTSQVYVSIEGRYRGSFRPGNVYRQGLPDLMNSLKNKYELFLLSGDYDHERKKLEQIFPEAHHLTFQQSPQDKLDFISRLQREGRTVAMIGDGLNDAGALQQSNVGIALTEKIGTFSPACDGILDATQLMRLPVYTGFARYALKVLFACFLLSLLYNTVGLSFAVMGKLSPMVAAILMPASSLSVVALAWGAMKIRENKIVATGRMVEDADALNPLTATS
jgi:Cu+-exporting ATPase